MMNPQVAALNETVPHTPAELYARPTSLPYKFRQKRFAAVRTLIERTLAEKGSCRILDIGGTERRKALRRPCLPFAHELAVVVVTARADRRRVIPERIPLLRYGQAGTSSAA